MEIYNITKSQIKAIAGLQALPEKGFIWIDANPDELFAVLEIIFQTTGVILNEEHILDCQNLQHPNFYEKTMLYDILIFRSLIAKRAPETMETAPITSLVLPKILITLNQGDEAIQRVKKRLQNTCKKLPVDATNLLFIILDEVVDNFLLLRTPLLDKYNDWERVLFNDSTKKIDWLKYLNFKSEVRQLRIISEEQQEVIYQWHQDNELGINEEVAIRYHDLLDHIKRIIRSATQLESELDTMTQLHYSLIGNRTNDTMRTLTVLSGIFLPLNLIAGIFGMNFVHMKVLQSEYAQDITMWGMLVLAILLLMIFRWKEWI